MLKRKRQMVFFVETLKRENIILCAKWMRQTNKQKSYTFRGNLGVKNIGKEECWRSAKKVMLLHPIPSKNKTCMFTILSNKKSKKKDVSGSEFCSPPFPSFSFQMKTQERRFKTIREKALRRHYLLITSSSVEDIYDPFSMRRCFQSNNILDMISPHFLFSRYMKCIHTVKHDWNACSLLPPLRVCPITYETFPQKNLIYAQIFDRHSSEESFKERMDVCWARAGNEGDKMK